MNTGNVVGYVGGLAVALGVGAAVTFCAPTASADTSSPSTHSASSGTATSARAPQRTNTVGSVKRAPARKAAAPAPGVTLLMAASVTPDSKRTPARALPSRAPAQAAAATSPTADAIPIDNGHSLAIDTTGDWSTGFTTRISVRDNDSGTQIGSTVTLIGASLSPAFTAGGDRVVVATQYATYPYTAQVAVIDTKTGTQIGSTLVLDGDPTTAPLVGGDDNHVLITTKLSSATGDSTHVALIDSSNGTQTGTTLVLTGRSTQGLLLDATGDHAVIATSTEVSYQKYVGQVALFDTRTGVQLGTTLNVTGSPDVRLLGDDGLALISSSTYDQATGGNTQFTVIDATTGAKVGTPITLDGISWNTPQVSTEGTNLMLLTTNRNPVTGSTTTSAAVLNTTNGTQAGQTVTLDGRLLSNPIVSADGIHILLAASSYTASSYGTTDVAVIDTATGEQAGTTIELEGQAAYAFPIADGRPVLITTYDGDASHIAVVDATTGEQTGTTLILTGRIDAPLVNADDIHALFTARTDAATQIAVLDTSTGKQTGTTVALTGSVRGPMVNADGIHAIFTASTDAATHVVVVDITTGEQTASADLAGTMGYAVTDAGQTHVLITTTDGGSTHFTSFDTATGQQTGVPLAFPGELAAWPYPSTAADGIHALFILDDADETHLVLIDITTGIQTGAGLTLTGDPGIPIVSDDGNHTTIVTRVAATGAHGSSTHVAVIDTTTGNQVGVTTRLTGTPAALPQLSEDGHHVVVSTFAGLSANLDTTTGTADVSTAGFPWGLDLEAFALTPLGRLVSAIQLAVFTVQVYAVGLLFYGYLILGSLFAQLQNNQPAAAPAAHVWQVTP